ncbi:MAG: hypothetical protein A3F91_09150 [Flavobacteria bacterium RIFCSPLOWO2_12_FULL_35_11]|nr:MAG: hypothetical protein A3F91_09150 [Flavobacteria bacterium RIFCSPLOWO2_12_FULL_35_11]
MVDKKGDMMTDFEIAKMLEIPLKTLADWKGKKSKRNKLYVFLSKMSLDEAQKIDRRELEIEQNTKFSPNAKWVKLDKSWFFTDLLWSSGNGQRIAVDTIIVVYMSNPDQRNTDVLIDLFGVERLEKVVNKHFDFDDFSKRTKPVALAQIRYGRKKVFRKSSEADLKIDIDKLAKVLKRATQKRIDAIVSRVDKDIVLEAAEKNEFPESFIIEDKVMYSLRKMA